jgi:hypothetical protein
VLYPEYPEIECHVGCSKSIYVPNEHIASIFRA